MNQHDIRRTKTIPRWTANGAGRWPLILMYHSIQRVRTDPWGLRVSPRNFAKQMAAIREHCEPMRLDEIEQCIAADRVPQRAVVVTFDDGFADNLHNALPILQTHSIPATVFVSSGYIGSQREYWWDDLERIFLLPPRLPGRFTITIGGESVETDLERSGRIGFRERWRSRRWRAWQHAPSVRHHLMLRIWNALRKSSVAEREAALIKLYSWAGVSANGRDTHQAMTRDELLQLAQNPLIEIGAHTVLHPRLSALSIDEQREEICRGKRWLEETLQRSIHSFAYPFGKRDDYADSTVAALRDSGFYRACSTEPGSVTPTSDRLQYPRRGVMDWNAADFVDRLDRWFGEETLQIETAPQT